jgi:hypothetical protein
MLKTVMEPRQSMAEANFIRSKHPSNPDLETVIEIRQAPFLDRRPAVAQVHLKGYAGENYAKCPLSGRCRVLSLEACHLRMLAFLYSTLAMIGRHVGAETRLC